MIGLAALVVGIVLATKGKRRGWLFIGLGLVSILSVPIGYVIYVAVIIVCTGRNGAWICDRTGSTPVQSVEG